MPKYKKALTELEKKLAKLLGKPGKDPKREIVEKTADMVSTAGAIKKFGPKKEGPGTVNWLIKKLKKENSELKNAVRNAKKIERPVKPGVTVDQTLTDVAEENKRLKSLIKRLDDYKISKDKRNYNKPGGAGDQRSISELEKENAKLRSLLGNLGKRGRDN